MVYILSTIYTEHLITDSSETLKANFWAYTLHIWYLIVQYWIGSPFAGLFSENYNTNYNEYYRCHINIHMFKIYSNTVTYNHNKTSGKHKTKLLWSRIVTSRIWTLKFFWFLYRGTNCQAILVD